MQTLVDVDAFIALFARKQTDGDGFHCGIWRDGELAGGVVCWTIYAQNRNCEIGYWLSQSFVGQGLVTRAARWVIKYLFGERGLNRVEMQCGLDNVRSRAVAETLGFMLEGVRRQSHYITNQFVDHAVYGLLAQEWRERDMR